VVLVDSITQAEPADDGCVVVCGSHGGSSSGEFALARQLRCVVFNDAGGGKDDAGLASLVLLQAHGRAAATVAHTSARIGDARDAWHSGVLSRVNAAAADLGARPGLSVQAWLAGPT
jgi:hypothetical protein